MKRKKTATKAQIWDINKQTRAVAEHLSALGAVLHSACPQNDERRKLCYRMLGLLRQLAEAAGVDVLNELLTAHGIEIHNGLPLFRVIDVERNRTPSVTGELLVRIYCPFCKDQHQHGWPAGLTSLEPHPLKPHCSEGSPLRTLPHYLIALSEPTRRMVRELSRGCNGSNDRAGAATRPPPPYVPSVAATV